MDTRLFPAQYLSAVPPIPQAPEPPRLRKAERRQVALLPICVDELIPPQHQARTLWALVEGLDLSGFQEDLKARGGEPGRVATDPKILVARERAARVEQALKLIPELEALKARQGQKKGPVQPARVSTTDPEARVMKMPDGGFRPAFNVQLAQDTESRAIVGVAVNNCGSDQGADQPMRRQIAAQTGAPVQEHLVDGGYAQHAAVENAAAEGVTLYAPVMQKKRKEGQSTDPYAPRPGDSPAVVAWRHRMASAAGQEIYKLRAATSETYNADLKCHRGLRSFRVRGLAKVLAVTLWSALAYNLLHFGPAVLEALRKG